ncbi:hypothetical protein QFC19_008324 [Naganishia cerealis]|uniref:Uncharacterized protein n=1 Tax=Naganishia cerealis TaxID=610337 RepID=A0ACC2V3F6_9TREE|nr:hypothetical protein QFC19_008324 [Naganishia cerealis]
MSRRISVRPVFQGFAHRLRHHPSFYVSVVAHLICATATIGFILAFIQQASFTGNTRRFNIVIISALLGAVLFTSCFLILARIIAVRTSFNTIPKPYIPTKHIDVPRNVAEHITTEYTRTAVIAYISQPTAEKQEGWGRPGTQFASIHFRRSIRETFHVIRKGNTPMFPLVDLLTHGFQYDIVKTLDDVPQTPGSSPERRRTWPPFAITQITSHPNWPPTAQPLLDMYGEILTKAKYARSEPDAVEYERCVKIVALIMGLIKTTHPQSDDLPVTPARVVFPDPGPSQTASTRLNGGTGVHDITENDAIDPLTNGTPTLTDRNTHLASPQPIYPPSRSRHNSVVRAPTELDAHSRASRYETEHPHRHPGLLSLFNHAYHPWTQDDPAPAIATDLHGHRVETVAQPARSAGNDNAASSSHSAFHFTATHRRRIPHFTLHELTRDHDVADDTRHSERQHQHHFLPLHSLPRPRRGRGETTRYIGGEEKDSGEEGDASRRGLFHNVWGTGRDADGDRNG